MSVYALAKKKAIEEDDEESSKNNVLAGVLYQIERSYGKGAIQRLGETQSLRVETSSTGSLTYDLALGGGYPRGRVIEIYGPESSGKTTLALHAVAEIQKNGGA
jgi:recombination protein RecA